MIKTTVWKKLGSRMCLEATRTFPTSDSDSVESEESKSDMAGDPQFNKRPNDSLSVVRLSPKCNWRKCPTASVASSPSTSAISTKVIPTARCRRHCVEACRFVATLIGGFSGAVFGLVVADWKRLWGWDVAYNLNVLW